MSSPADLAYELREYADRTTGYIYADEVAVLRSAADALERAERAEAALRLHLRTHNGAPGDPEPLCSCKACRVGRAALAGEPGAGGAEAAALASPPADTESRT